MQKGFIDVRVKEEVDLSELLALLDGAGALGAWEDEGELRLYWASDKWREEYPGLIRCAIERLGGGPEASIEVHLLPDQDWSGRWAASILPIRVGRRFLIRQSWNSVELLPGELELIIDPKRAFGTGYHETTQMLMEWLEERIAGGERVLDLGTGSGILAMAALRLGAAKAVGLDNDPEAIECAREYATANGMADELELRVATLEDVVPGDFDLVLANLDRRTLLGHTAALGRNMRRGGCLLISGLQAEDEEDMRAAIEGIGMEPAGKRVRGDWLSMEARFSPAEKRKIDH